MPDEIARRALDYVRGNSGAEPYSDGYEAMECIQAAESSHVLSCTVNWPTAECKRLGGCYLCGGMHTENKIWLSAYANNNLKSDYHWHATACYDICQERGKPELYAKAFEAAKASCS